MKRIRKAIWRLLRLTEEKVEDYIVCALSLIMLTFALNLAFDMMCNRLGDMLSTVCMFVVALLGVIIEIILFAMPDDKSS